MIHRLEIENFYSIRDAQVVDLTTTYDVQNEPYRFAPIFSAAESKVPKVIALYGANAAGKSNVLRALSFLTWFVRHSFQNMPGAALPYSRFLSTNTAKRPTRLAVYFSANPDLKHLDKSDAPTCKYEYELVLGVGKHNSNEVISETLNFWPSGKKTRVIERDKEGNVLAHRGFPLSGYAVPLKNILRKDASVIATLAQLKHPLAAFFWNASNLINSNIIVQRQEHNDLLVTHLYQSNPDWIKGLNQDIERIDVGISQVEVKAGVQGAANPFFALQHNGLDEPIGLHMESNGTRQFIQIFPFIFQALKTGGIAVIDDIDLSIHPLIMPEIVRWFHDPERNKKNAQLWMTCQNPTLLKELVKEEVVFCEKDINGCTSVYGLKDINGVRREDNYYQKYLAGVYGAVPQIG